MPKFKYAQLVLQLLKAEKQLAQCTEKLKIPSFNPDLHIDLEHAIAAHAQLVERLSKLMGVEISA
jgi:hypothetical protein